KFSSGGAVEEDRLSGTAVRGVRLEDGRSIGARAVLSTADPHTTLLSLLPEGILARATTARVEHSPANGVGVSPFKVDLALSSRVTVPGHTLYGVDLRVPVLLLGTVEEVVDSLTLAPRKTYRK